MGKITRWLRSLLGAKKSSSPSPPSSAAPESRPAKDKWDLVRSFNGNGHFTGGPKGSITELTSSPYVQSLDANKHAIAVAAATAAVAEAALAAAQAAAEVVRLTSGGSRGTYVGDRRRELSAVKIQSAFRAYLVSNTILPVFFSPLKSLLPLGFRKNCIIWWVVFASCFFSCAYGHVFVFGFYKFCEAFFLFSHIGFILWFKSYGWTLLLIFRFVKNTTPYVPQSHLIIFF